MQQPQRRQGKKRLRLHICQKRHTRAAIGIPKRDYKLVQHLVVLEGGPWLVDPGWRVVYRLAESYCRGIRLRPSSERHYAYSAARCKHERLAAENHGEERNHYNHEQ